LLAEDERLGTMPPTIPGLDIRQIDPVDDKMAVIAKVTAIKELRIVPSCLGVEVTNV